MDKGAFQLFLEAIDQYNQGDYLHSLIGANDALQKFLAERPDRTDVISDCHACIGLSFFQLYDANYDLSAANISRDDMIKNAIYHLTKITSESQAEFVKRGYTTLIILLEETRDYKNAAYYASKAVEAGVPYGFLQCGIYYSMPEEYGNCVEKNLDIAKKCLEGYLSFEGESEKGKDLARSLIQQIDEAMAPKKKKKKFGLF